MKTITKPEAISIIGQEIIWHEENPDKALSKEYQKGFINGMIHIRALLGEANRIMQNELAAIVGDGEQVSD